MYVTIKNPEIEHVSEAETVVVETDAGAFWIGVDNDGRTYISSYTSGMIIRPSSSNRITIEKDNHV